MELPYQDKIKFLQLANLEARIEFLIKALGDKTESMKSVFGIEDKVRQ